MDYVKFVENLLKSAEEYQAPGLSVGAQKVLDRFENFSEYNRELILRQGALPDFVATVQQWEKWFGRTVNIDATPIAVMTDADDPIEFFYDYSDTTGTPLPYEDTELHAILFPFERPGLNNEQYEKFVRNVKRNNINYFEKDLPYSRGGCCRMIANEYHFDVDILVNSRFDSGAKTWVLIHELAHWLFKHRKEGFLFYEVSDYTGKSSGNVLEAAAETVVAVVAEMKGFSILPSIRYLSDYMSKSDCNQIFSTLVLENKNMISACEFILHMIAE